MLFRSAGLRCALTRIAAAELAALAGGAAAEAASLTTGAGSEAVAAAGVSAPGTVAQLQRRATQADASAVSGEIGRN